MLNQIIETVEALNNVNGKAEVEKLVSTLGSQLSQHVGKRVNLNKVTKRDVSILLTTLGADEVTVDTYANQVARRMRSNRFEHGSWSATI